MRKYERQGSDYREKLMKVFGFEMLERKRLSSLGAVKTAMATYRPISYITE